jgi:hypothetical protein
VLVPRFPHRLAGGVAAGGCAHRLTAESACTTSTLLQYISKHLQPGEAGYGSFSEPELGLPAQ